MPFVIKNVKNTVGSAGLCPIGRTFNSSYKEATISIQAEGMRNACIFINHRVLKEALLNSPEILKDMGIEVREVNEVVKKKVKETKKDV